MTDVTRILSAIDHGDPQAADQLLPLVYVELRKLAAAKLAHEQPGQTLNATALVHEAYLRLVAQDSNPVKSNTGLESCATFANRRHFFAAAAEAMRRILVENARRKKAVKHGGDWSRTPLDAGLLASPEPREDLLALDTALTKLTAQNPDAARLVELRYFAGLTLPEAAEAMGISARSAGRVWAYARAWLRREVEGAGEGSSDS